ncbi:hypothetical protein EDB81DRAFT_949013 [Dactylonectria macrodidyma]|uniref:Zn(2)-C6 fungal-type domain-containing protein n=1 Tax=Dactylonectria macrodidyma TaxID=307937 RepID=A0A9P9EEX0_9HYPO|nr:hypothetical protein EDB81DRAFT_949013 [Dactylonectria macrodidyma]
MGANCEPSGKTRRTANACIPCRQSKIKCSGKDPCANCQRRSVPCHFTEGADMVMVSAKYLHELQKKLEEVRQSPESNRVKERAHHRSPPRASSSIYRVDQSQSPLEAHILLKPMPTAQAYCSPPGARIQVHDSMIDPALGTKRTRDVAFGLDDDSGLDPHLASPSLTVDGSNPPSTATKLSLRHQNESGHSIWPSAFTLASKTIKNIRKNGRQWVWLAPWSTWSFTVRLMLMLSEKLHGNSAIPLHLSEDEIYILPPKPPLSDFPDIRCLPSLDHAIYLFNAVKFHLGHTYRFFDDMEFESQIRSFYSGNAAQKAADSPLWFAKFLLVLAFGTAFNPRPIASREPPGGKFFVRAMALIPDHMTIWKDSLLATEVLAMAGLYLFSIDERESAYVYLGHALRIAQFEGLHTQLPESELGTETVTWCRDLWWTLYIMDRHFSASVGLPMSVQDSDITMSVNPPNLGSQGDSARSLQVNLSHLLSVTLTTVYKPMKTSLATYLEQTRSTLSTLAHHAQEIEKIIRLKFQDSIDTMPKGTRHITLLYHQCVMVATRPLLLSVLKERLDMLGHQGDENWETFLAHTGAIISTGIKSAVKTLQILSSEYSLLEIFLPYDLEFTFGAALHLAMANALFPDVVDDQGCYAQLARGILSDMISRGNRVAKARKMELEYLEALCQELVTQVQRQGLQTLTLFGLDDTQRLFDESDAAMTMTANGFMSDQAPVSNNMDFLDNIGISSEEFLSIVQQIGDFDSVPDEILALS